MVSLLHLSEAFMGPNSVGFHYENFKLGHTIERFASRAARGLQQIVCLRTEMIDTLSQPALCSSVPWRLSVAWISGQARLTEWQAPFQI